MSCLAQGRGLYTDSQSKPSDWDTRHHGSTLPSCKRAERHQCNLAGKCRQVWGPPVCPCPRCIERPGHMGLVDKGCPRLMRRSPLYYLHLHLGSQLTGLAVCSQTFCRCLLDLPWVPPQCQEGRSTQPDGRRLCSLPLGCSKVNHRRRSGHKGLCRMNRSRRDHLDRCCAARRCTPLECSLSHRSLCIPRCKDTLVDLPLSCCRCQVCSMH